VSPRGRFHIDILPVTENEALAMTAALQAHGRTANEVMAKVKPPLLLMKSLHEYLFIEPVVAKIMGVDGKTVRRFRLEGREYSNDGYLLYAAKAALAVKLLCERYLAVCGRPKDEILDYFVDLDQAEEFKGIAAEYLAWFWGIQRQLGFTFSGKGRFEAGYIGFRPGRAEIVVGGTIVRKAGIFGWAGLNGRGHVVTKRPIDDLLISRGLLVFALEVSLEVGGMAPSGAPCLQVWDRHGQLIHRTGVDLHRSQAGFESLTFRVPSCLSVPYGSVTFEVVAGEIQLWEQTLQTKWAGLHTWPGAGNDLYTLKGVPRHVSGILEVPFTEAGL
jgi:hypothetical protein